jgi:hypothetical protein
LLDPNFSLLQSVQDAEQNYSEEKDRDLSTNSHEEKKLTRENVFGAGQSKRIWNELYKVIDSSDVIIQVSILHLNLIFGQSVFGQNVFGQIFTFDVI